MFRLKRCRFSSLQQKPDDAILQMCYAFWFISIIKLNFLRDFGFNLLYQDPKRFKWSFDKSVE